MQEQYNALQVEAASVASGIESDGQTAVRLKGERADLYAAIERQRADMAEYEKEIARWEREAERQALTKAEQETVDRLRAEIERAGAEKQKINLRQIEVEPAQSGVQ